MRCAKCQRFYDAAVEEKLTERQRRKVHEHLNDCPACSVVWQENEALRAMLRQSAEPDHVPGAPYFAQLARNAVAAVEADKRAEAANPPPGFWPSLA